jgi:CRP/FNR family transcriptional regulator, anaerobic regulatory protein
MGEFAQFKTWLKQVSFLTEQDCNLFQPFLHKKQVAAKAHLLQQDKICREIGFINSGAFRMYYLSDGKEINTHFSFDNEFVVDYDSFLHHKPSRYCIQALEDAEIVTFNLEALQQAYNQSQNWERFGRTMAEYSYKITTQRVESFLFLDGEQRYKQLLDNQPQIFERVPLYHIASYLGLERESLSRLRKKITAKKRL